MNAYLLILLVGFVSSTYALFGIGRDQSIAVSGTLTCNGRVARDVKVKLYEKEKIKDNKLDEVRTDSMGKFHVSGYDTEITRIDPAIYIYHKCNSIGPCYQRIKFTIPSSYITSGKTPKSTYSIGTIDLATKFPGQKRDCIN